MRTDHPDRPEDTARRGTTLVEAMMAIMVLGGVIGGACQLTVTAKSISDQSRGHYQAINIARNHLERVRVMGYDQLPYCVESAVRVDHRGVTDSDGRFQRSTAIATISQDLKEVKVVVDLMDRITLDFEGESEEISSLMTPFKTTIE